VFVVAAVACGSLARGGVPEFDPKAAAAVVH
jgi:hypothetical protein